jgi:hypothetical protein
MDTGPIRISSEKILQMPELAHLYEAVLFLEKNDGKVLFPKKYEASMLDRASEKTRVVFSEQPKLLLKDAVIVTLSRLKSDISGELLLKMTEKIIQEWEALSAKALQTMSELQPA